MFEWAFSVFQNMIHIADTKVARRYGDFFVRQILKFEEVCTNIDEQCWSFFHCRRVIAMCTSGLKKVVSTVYIFTCFLFAAKSELKDAEKLVLW